MDGAVDKMFDEIAEALIVRPILHHKRRETNFGIDGDVSIVGHRSLKIHGPLRQTISEFPEDVQE